VVAGVVTGPGGIPLPGNRWDLLDGRAPAEPPNVTVVIAHYEQPRQLAVTLAALRSGTHPAARLQIIVTDDGSAVPPAVPHGVELVRQRDEGFRLAAARNRGAAHARGDVIVFLDADTVPEPDFISEIVRLPALAPDVVAVGRRRHADLAGVGPSADIRLVAERRILPEPGWLSDAYLGSRNLLDADDRSYRFVIGAAVACSRRFFEEVGGFNESFDSYGGEDWEWAYRAWLAGAVLAHVPTAVAWHDGPDASVRGESRATKNAEALRLADRIPVPGSRPRGIRPAAADIVVIAPAGASEAASFVSVDSAVAAVPGSEEAVLADVLAGTGRFDRVRIRIELLRPVRVSGSGLADLVERVASEGLGQVVAVTSDETPVLRVVSVRAERRRRRWGRDDLFPDAVESVPGVEALPDEVDVEGYLGGW